MLGSPNFAIEKRQGSGKRREKADQFWLLGLHCCKQLVAKNSSSLGGAVLTRIDILLPVLGHLNEGFEGNGCIRQGVQSQTIILVNSSILSPRKILLGNEVFFLKKESQP